MLTLLIYFSYCDRRKEDSYRSGTVSGARVPGLVLDRSGSGSGCAGRRSPAPAAGTICIPDDFLDEDFPVVMESDEIILVVEEEPVVAMDVHFQRGGSRGQCDPGR